MTGSGRTRSESILDVKEKFNKLTLYFIDFEHVRHDFIKHLRLRKVIVIEAYMYTLIWYNFNNDYKYCSIVYDEIFTRRVLDCSVI